MAICRPSSDPAHRIAYPNQIDSKFCLKTKQAAADAPLLHGASGTAGQQKRERVAMGAPLNKATLDCAGIYFRQGAS